MKTNINALIMDVLALSSMPEISVDIEGAAIQMKVLLGFGVLLRAVRGAKTAPMVGPSSGKITLNNIFGGAQE